MLATSEVREDGGTDVLGGPANQRAARAAVGNAALSEADSDRVIRRYARATDGLESLAVVAARELDGRPPPRGPFRPDGAWIDYPGPPGTIDTVRFSDLLAGRVPASRLRGKVAVVGVTDPNEKDVYATPGRAPRSWPAPSSRPTPWTPSGATSRCASCRAAGPRCSPPCSAWRCRWPR